MSNSKPTSNSIGFTGLLTIMFITLKLLGKITWSWWWVLSPIWICIVILAAVFVITLAVIVRRAIRER